MEFFCQKVSDIHEIHKRHVSGFRGPEKARPSTSEPRIYMKCFHTFVQIFFIFPFLGCPTVQEWSSPMFHLSFILRAHPNSLKYRRMEDIQWWENMINALKVRLSLGPTNSPSLPNGSTKPDAGELNHTTVDCGQRSPSRTRKRAIDQAPYQESVAARELRIFYNRNKLCNSFKKVLSSSAGLFIVLLLYICLGAVLFQHFERGEEFKARYTLNETRYDNVAKEIESCKDTECIVLAIRVWEKLLLENYPVFYIINEDPVWTFENAFYFCFTTISTIGKTTYLSSSLQRVHFTGWL